MPKSPAKASFLANIPEQYKHLSPAYAWRVFRGDSEGISRSQARGHARAEKGELPVSAGVSPTFRMRRYLKIISLG